MADVATKCYPNENQVSGRAITRMPNTRIFRVTPTITSQYTSDQLDSKYNDRLDHRAYYYDIAAH